MRIVLISVRLENDDGLNTEFYGGYVYVYNAIADRWEDVCDQGWGMSQSDMLCKQLGYRYVEVT